MTEVMQDVISDPMIEVGDEMKRWLDFAGQNPATASYLMGRSLLKNAQAGIEPTESEIQAFLKLKNRAVIAVGTSLMGLQSCRQTAALGFASDALANWCRESREERQAHPLVEQHIELERLQERYIGMMGATFIG